MKFSIKDLVSKCDQIRIASFQSLIENFIFCEICVMKEKGNIKSVYMMPLEFGLKSVKPEND